MSNTFPVALVIVALTIILLVAIVDIAVTLLPSDPFMACRPTYAVVAAFWTSGKIALHAYYVEKVQCRAVSLLRNVAELSVVVAP